MVRHYASRWECIHQTTLNGNITPISVQYCSDHFTEGEWNLHGSMIYKYGYTAAQLPFSLHKTSLQYQTDSGPMLQLKYVVRYIHSCQEIVPHQPVRLQQTRLHSWWEKYCRPNVVPFPAALVANMAANAFREVKNPKLTA